MTFPLEKGKVKNEPSSLKENIGMKFYDTEYYITSALRPQTK